MSWVLLPSALPRTLEEGNSRNLVISLGEAIGRCRSHFLVGELSEKGLTGLSGLHAPGSPGGSRYP